MGMNTDIHTIDEQYTSEVIDFNDAHLGEVITELDHTLAHLETVRSELTSMGYYESSWSGKSKTTYEDLKHFIDQYQKDYLSSVQELKKTATGLETLFGSISSAKAIREIDNA